MHALSVRSRLGAALSCWWGAALLLACAPLHRNEPTLEEKCQELATYCAELPSAREDLRRCQEIGQRGERDARRADECFVAYDECIDECYYLTSLATQGDAGE